MNAKELAIIGALCITLGFAIYCPPLGLVVAGMFCIVGAMFKYLNEK